MPPAAAIPGGAATPPSKPQSPLRITHDGEFYARLLTKESSGLGGNPSFRYYGAGPGAVPFVWETQPGTPKDAYSSSRMLAAAGAAAPAITPPPSYHLRGGGAAPLGHHGSRRHAGRYCRYKLRWIKVGFIATVFRRLAFGSKSKSCRSSSSAAASVKSSSSSTRWLFSGSSAAEAREEECCGAGYEHAPPARRVLCLGVRPSPWLVQFCGGDRKEPGWEYGWRP
ncbi:unnamed protein product [Urochloa humidicola]